MAILTLRPTSDFTISGRYVNITTVPAGGSPYYEKVDEVVSDQTDYIVGACNGGGVNEYIICAFGTSSLASLEKATINSLKIYVDQYLNGQSPACWFGFQLAAGDVLCNKTYVYAVNWIWTTNPLTGLGWVYSDISGKFLLYWKGTQYTNDSKSTFKLFQIYAEINYSLPVSKGASLLNLI